MQYAFPYLAFSILLGLLAMAYQRVDGQLRSRMSIACFFLMAFFFALRGYVGDDWVGYHPTYTEGLPSDIHFDIWNRYGWRFEPGYTLLVICCKAIAGPDGFLFFQGVGCLIQLALLFRFFRIYATNLPFSLYVFLAMGGFLMLINAMRNTIAICIFLNALPYLQNRRPVPYFLCCLLACTFHASSICFFPLYFFFHRHLNRWIYLTIFIIGNCVVLFRLPVLSVGIRMIAAMIGGRLDFMVNAYLGDANMSSKAFMISIGYLERLFTGTLLFIFYDRLIALRRHNVMFVNAFTLFFFFYFFFSEVYEVGRRLSDLFFFGYWILWYDFFKCLTLRTNKILYAAFIALYCSIKVFGLTGYANTKYENVLFGHTPYEVRLAEHVLEHKEILNLQ